MGRGLASVEDSVDKSIRLEDEILKNEQRKTKQSLQEQHMQPKDQQNNDNWKTKMERKTTVWTLQVTSKRNLSWEKLDMVKKGKP